MVSINTWGFVGIVIGLIILGLVAGYFLARYLFKKEMEKHPPISEKAVRAMFKAMGRPASEKQIKQVMASMKQADKK